LASYSKLTAQKRQRERARQDWQKEKAARREFAKTQKQNAPTHQSAEERDLAGIVAGPQPSPWADEPMPAGMNPAKKEDGSD